MSTYFVATLSMWTLVDAADESAAREAALPGLKKLYAEAGSRIGKDFPIEIHTVRLATQGEIEQLRWHHEMVAKHAAKYAWVTPQTPHDRAGGVLVVHGVKSSDALASLVLPLRVFEHSRPAYQSRVCAERTRLGRT